MSLVYKSVECWPALLATGVGYVEDQENHFHKQSSANGICWKDRANGSKKYQSEGHKPTTNITSLLALKTNKMFIVVGEHSECRLK